MPIKISKNMKTRNSDDKELEKLKIAINRTYTEKFYALTALIKAQRLMNAAKIQHKH